MAVIIVGHRHQQFRAYILSYPPSKLRCALTFIALLAICGLAISCCYREEEVDEKAVEPCMARGRGLFMGEEDIASSTNSHARSTRRTQHDHTARSHPRRIDTVSGFPHRPPQAHRRVRRRASATTRQPELRVSQCMESGCRFRLLAET